MSGSGRCRIMSDGARSTCGKVIAVKRVYREPRQENARHPHADAVGRKRLPHGAGCSAAETRTGDA